MIIKNLAAMCRRTKHIVIFEDEPNDIQWIGTLRGIYPAYGVPRMETEQVKFLFDIPEEKRDECIAHNMKIMPEFPAHDILTAIAVGIVSGWGSVGIYETWKNLAIKIPKEEKEEKETEKPMEAPEEYDNKH